MEALSGKPSQRLMRFLLSAAAACFTVRRERDDPLVAIELSGDERADVQAKALDALRGRATSG